MNRKNRSVITTAAAAVAAAGALFLSTAASQAGNATTNVMSFSGSLGAWWLNGWGGQSAGTAYDANQDHTGDGGGSLYLVDDYSGGDQWVNIGWIGGQMWGGNAYDLTGWTNISFYVKWDKTTATEEISTFNGSPGETPQFWGATANNGNWFTIGTFTIPDTASNGWVKVNVPIDPSVPGITGSYCVGFKKWTGTGNTGIAAFWVDDITLEGNPAVAIPPPTITPSFSKPTQGLNLWALTGPYNRENIVSANDQSWIGQPGPVSYSFTVAQGVDGTAGAQYQNHIFLVSSPGTESGPDWNEANVIFLDLESQTNGGAAWTFRYKTNQPSANSMMFDTNVVPGGITAPSPVGTWTVTFNGNSVTMTNSPSGVSTNFTFSNPTDLAALWPSPVTAYFGCQANNTAGVGQDSVLSEIKITGTANPVDTHFTGGVAVDPALWLTNASDAGSVFVTPADVAYWLKWSIPDTGFAPLMGTSLKGITNDITPSLKQVGSQRWALLTTSMIPAGNTAFYRLIKRQFTQLQVLLPGETNAPNTITGKTGTPTAVNIGDAVPVTVNSVDPTFHIVSSTDGITLTSLTDSGATMPLPANLTGGTVSMTVYFGTSGSQTVTATDTTNTNIPAATSSPQPVN